MNLLAPRRLYGCVNAIRSLLMVLALVLPPAVPAADDRVPVATLQALQRGINLSSWFTYRGELDSWWQRRMYPDDGDWVLLDRQHIDHVRVQFDPAWFRSAGTADGLDAARMATLRQALAPAFKRKLLVVLAAEPKTEEKARFVRDAAGRTELAEFWRAFAKALSDLSARQLAFEALNEPVTADATQNQPLMLQLAQAIRSVAPRHTVIVEGAQYSGVDDLVAMTPLPLGNLVYSFHFYEPFNFTHQGATWTWPMVARMKGLPYPSNPYAVADAAARADDDELRGHIRAYGEARWDGEKIAARVQRVADWAQRFDQPVWCGEFGVSRLGPPLEDRRKWIVDVRRALESRGIGWSAFDYAGHFGLVTELAGARKLDPADAAAAMQKLPAVTTP